jgi:osmotically-inducible protein OsmY
MNNGIRLTLASSALAVALASGSFPSLADTLSQDITEARLETQIWTTYALSPYLRASDLKVAVKGGKATLSGKVEESVNKDLAKQIALGVKGIHEVDNQIVVQADYVPAKSASGRGYGDTVDDANITATVKSKLLWSRHTDGVTTDVDTQGGKVTLRGKAETASEKSLAGRLAQNTRGVTGVDNQLVVTPANGSTKPGTEIADGWITTKVKSTYLYSSNVDGGDISVKTTAGVVTLSGKVDSGAERALAIEFAQNVRGVKSVQAKNLTL